MIVPSSYRTESSKYYPEQSEKEMAARYANTRRTWIREYTAALRGERSPRLSELNREHLNELFPEWETLLMAAKTWERDWP